MTRSELRSSRLERAARAICRIDLRGWPDDRMEEGINLNWPNYVPAMRAALEAIRSPSDAMIEAAWDVADEQSATATWRAMLDAILDEPTDPVP